MREHSSRVRVEPYVDIGLLTKPDKFRYEYTFSPIGCAWAQAVRGIETSDEVEEFLTRRFFGTAARGWEMEGRLLSDPEEIAPRLRKAWNAISSASGYAPIEEVALVAGIDGLLDDRVVIEPAVAKEAIIAYQKAHPYEVRFTVDRLGRLAHMKFVE